MSLLDDIPAIRRFGFWTCFMLGFVGFGWLAEIGAGIDDLSTGEEATARDMGILLANATLLLGLVITYFVFRRACKRYGVEGSPMHPLAKLLTGLVLTAGLTLVFAGIG
jgi:hypothetical protein